MRQVLALWVVGLAMAGEVLATEFVKGDAFAIKNQWVKENLLKARKTSPFSFIYDGQASSRLLRDWERMDETRAIDAVRTQHTSLWIDPMRKLQVRCVTVEYTDFPAVEWTVYFKNRSTGETPILENIQGLDTRFERPVTGEFVLHGLKGDWCTADSYEPYQLTLGTKAVYRFAPFGGKSCCGPKGWPYYNLQMSGGGVLMAVGWPGQWASTFTRDDLGLQVTAGQELFRAKLKPGEEIRSPLMALVFWRGSDPVAAQNLWRRWYLAHALPRIQGQPQPPVAQIQVGGSIQETATYESFLESGIQVDVCWRDAGDSPTSTWFPSANGPYKTMTWLNSGTWEIDTARYPKGFKPFSDWVHAHQMQFLLWFEPERVGDPHSWLGKNHPEWLLPGTSHGALLDEGNPKARAWLVDHIDGLIKSQGLDWYREDMNGDGPLPAWRRHDGPDRQGITENLYVQGHLAFWDELRRRHPGLHIDSCASGGRRNDLETMRRAVPLLRSDFQIPSQAGVIEGNQGHTFGLSSWFPYQGSGCYFNDPYAYRSFYLPGFGLCNVPFDARVVKAYAECRKIAPLMLGDYYPLTPYNLQLDQWIAWQFHRPEQGDGVFQAFRREKSAEAAKTFRLKGLDPAATYEVKNFDVVGAVKVSGKDLMDPGLTVKIGEKRGSAVIAYQALR